MINLNLLEICLLSGLLFCLLIQLYFSVFIHAKLASFKVNTIVQKAEKPISVIICARNEAENLVKYLPLVLEQNYPNFEVIVVNDRSWDDTEGILKDFSERYAKLKIVTIADGGKFIAGKKFAVSMGIKPQATIGWFLPMQIVNQLQKIGC